MRQLRGAGGAPAFGRGTIAFAQLRQVIQQVGAFIVSFFVASLLRGSPSLVSRKTPSGAKLLSISASTALSRSAASRSLFVPRPSHSCTARRVWISRASPAQNRSRCSGWYHHPKA